MHIQNTLSHKKISKGLHLNGLDGIRAIAAICVLVVHACESLGISSISFLAELSVTVFFTLSGFLITYLLFKEIDETGSIAVKKFYLRRILRIWPLYYLYLGIILLVNFFILLSPVSLKNIIFYGVLMPNIPVVVMFGMPLAVHYWSLGVEEQFYLVWPHFIKKSGSKFLLISIVVIMTSFLLRLIFIQYGEQSRPYKFMYYCRYDCMIIGGVAAYLFSKAKHLLGFAKNIYFQLGSFALLLLILSNVIRFSGLVEHQVAAIMISIVMISQVSAVTTIVNLENSLFKYLGKISYGIYVFHPLIIWLTLTMLRNYDIRIEGWRKIMACSLIVAVTIVVAHLSYRYFEAFFLRRKQKYAVSPIHRRK